MKFKHLTIAVLSALSLPVLAQQKTLTTNAGVPVGDNQNSKTVGQNGPVLLEDIHLIEKLAAFDRERIPERVVHARGVGAYGEFITAADFSVTTKAKLFNEKGKVTPVFVRFSTVMGGGASPETQRDPRGFAVKFYTEQGNYDIVGIHIPIFFIRDAIKFPDFVHALKPSPIYNKQDPNRIFNFFSHVPEATHMLTRLYTDNGIPANYRQMDGSGVHAYKWVNAEGQVNYVKYTWKSKQGIKNLTTDEAAAIQGKDFQHATVDLYENINKKNYPAWDLYVQMLKPEDLDKFDFNPLDDTKIWPDAIAKPILAGTMTLNKVPGNFFDEVEESAFSPGQMVPGIAPSEDKMLQGRLFSYFDTQRYRIGPNFQRLPVNAPKTQVNSYNQDGPMSSRGQNSDINFQPSTDPNGNVDDAQYDYPAETFTNVASVQKKISKPNDFKQAGEFYRSLSETEKAHLINNLSGDLALVTDRNVVKKMVGYFYMADSDYGKRLAAKLHVTRDEVEAMFTAH